MIKRMLSLLRVLIPVACLLLHVTGGLEAAQQYQGLCSYVKMEILQELALERIGFLATLEVTNNEGDASITDFSAVLTFAQQPLAPDDEASDAADLFFVQPPELEGIAAVNGTGIIRPGETATIRWFIIPKITAGGTDPIGLQYIVGADLGGSIYGLQIAPQILAVIPDTITVKPEPQLEITYFQPRDVDGDDPFTPEVVEAPVPFTLGVLVNNVGHGRADSVRVESEQPRIVEDLQGLQVIPRLLGTRVDDEPTNYASLTLTLGDIEPGRCRKGAWDMITTLSGEFTEFKASYTHASELGGRDTSVITALDAYFMVHEVLNDQPGRDELLDFLADTIDDSEMQPDIIYESDCLTTPVNPLTDVEVLQYSHPVATVRAAANFENWVYLRLADPAQAKYPIASVIRSDGKPLNPHNYWTHIRYREADNAKLTYLNIFDFVALGEYEYTVTYAPPGSDTQPPVTTLLFSGQHEETGGKHYVLPETQILFFAEDDSPVGTYYRLDTAPDFVPAYPISIADAGEHTLEYFSEDFDGNQEVHQAATIVVSAADPGIENIVSDTDRLFIVGDSISVRPTRITVTFNGVITAGSLDAFVEVFRGVLGYATLSGVPSSPIAGGEAAITVGGENVDYYRYRVAGEIWSGEYPVSQTIQLSGLNGDVQLAVSGRSEYGNYQPAAEAVVASWTVDPGAPPITISGTPATPSRLTQATLNVAGSDYYCYRVDDSYYQPDNGSGIPITLSGLSEGAHSVEILSRATADEICPAGGAGTIATWTVDRRYGLAFPAETRVRYESLGPVAADPTEFVWDGRDDGGVMVPPGWYTIKLAVSDGLGRSTGAVKLVQVGDMLSDGVMLSGAGNAGQKEAHAFGKWAVWQDQRNGSWDIYALDLTDETAAPVAVRSNNLNQERPRTDGTYVVWQDRQADGTWDIWARKLGSAEPPFPITETPAADEQKPSVYWPWIVYQTKPVTDPTAAWQLEAYHMLSEISLAVDPTTQDQLDPWIHKQRVVWQDFRDAGAGEVYFKNLKTGGLVRITDNAAGQYHPVIYEKWIVWADNRDTQLDLYAYNLQRNAEIQLSETAEDETSPRIAGRWVVYSEDSAGGLNTNLRILALSNLAALQLTNFESEKEKPSMASGKLVWIDSRSGFKQAMLGSIPDLQPVFNNQNAVAVTDGMVSSLQDGYTLLKLWNTEAGVTAITRYTNLVPTVVSQTITWDNGQPAGNNFNLATGSFLWVKFDRKHILDLGAGACNPLDLGAGLNVFNYTCFPDHYTAYKLMREIGEDKINALRMLNSDTGRWQVVTVVNHKIAGVNFDIPRIAVVMMDMKTPINSWQPGE
jgi:beta propeller repeat protein